MILSFYSLTVGGYLRRVGKRGILIGDMGGGRVALVEQHPVAEGDLLAQRDSVVSYTLSAQPEIVEPERIGSEEAVVAGVPGGGVAQVGGGVEDGDAVDLLPQRPPVVHP